MTKYILHVEPNITKILKGKKSRIDRYLRLRNRQAFFTKMYQYGLWDGFNRFVDMDTGEFPTGLLELVLKNLKEDGISVTVRNKIKRPKCIETHKDFLLGITLRDYQLEAVNTCLREGWGCVSAATGSGKTAMCAAVAGNLFIQHGIRTLLIVPKLGLLVQTCDEFRKFLGPDISVGKVGGGRRDIDSDIVICTPQTLRFALPEKEESIGHRKKVSRKHEPQLLSLLRSCGCLILDEAHHSSSDTYYELSKLCPAPFRFAFSGTPTKGKPWEDRRLWAVVGKLIYTVKSKELVDRDILAKPYVYFVTDDSINNGKYTVKRDYYYVFSKCILKDKRYNASIARIAKHLISQGKPPLILSHRVAHLERLKSIFDQRGIPCELLHGKHSVSVRTEVKERFKNGEHFAIFASTIFDEGEDIPNIASIILAGGGKAPVALNQRIGRGLRKKKDNRLTVIDFIHSNSRLLSEHAKNRLRLYKKEGITVNVIPDIKRLSHYDF